MVRDVDYMFFEFNDRFYLFLLDNNPQYRSFEEIKRNIVTLYPPEVGNVSIYSFLFTTACNTTSIYALN